MFVGLLYVASIIKEFVSENTNQWTVPAILKSGKFSKQKLKSIANSSFNFFIPLGKTKKHTLFDEINYFQEIQKSLPFL